MLYKVEVKPRSRNNAVVENEGGYIVYTKEAPEAGKANKSVIGLLAEQLQIPKSFISIKSGRASRTKIIEIEDI